MLYRFRSTDRVLNYKEIENNYFYFASPSQQNDPMEGYIDFFWKGDWIAWMGLFKHYTWQVFMTLFIFYGISTIQSITTRILRCVI